jgi:hypothetical protein
MCLSSGWFETRDNIGRSSIEGQVDILSSVKVNVTVSSELTACLDKILNCLALF